MDSIHYIHIISRRTEDAAMAGGRVCATILIALLTTMRVLSDVVWYLLSASLLFIGCHFQNRVNSLTYNEENVRISEKPTKV